MDGANDCGLVRSPVWSCLRPKEWGFATFLSQLRFRLSKPLSTFQQATIDKPHDEAFIIPVRLFVGKL
jgi:hypothetical protein